MLLTTYAATAIIYNVDFFWGLYIFPWVCIVQLGSLNTFQTKQQTKSTLNTTTGWYSCSILKVPCKTAFCYRHEDPSPIFKWWLKERPTDRQTDRQTDWPIDRQMDRQTDRWTNLSLKKHLIWKPDLNQFQYTKLSYTFTGICMKNKHGKAD